MTVREIIKKRIVESIQSEQTQYFPKIGLSTEDCFNMIEYHDNYADLYPNYSDGEDVNEYSDEYYFSTKEIAYREVNRILEMFESLPEPIPIYRSIAVSNTDNIDWEWLGNSWSFDRDSAINFAKNHAGGNVLLTAETNFDNIDWKQTLTSYFLFSGGNDGYDENELYVMDSDDISSVTVEKIKKSL